MCASMADIQPATADIRREKKIERKKDRRNHGAKMQWPSLLHRTAIIIYKTLIKISKSLIKMKQSCWNQRNLT